MTDVPAVCLRTVVYCSAKTDPAGLRFFTVYGPYGRPDMACIGFASDILDGRPITLYQQPNSKRDVVRDFTYIDDIVSGIMGSIVYTRTAPPGGFKVFNLGRGQPHAVSELVHHLEVSLKATANVVYHVLSPTAPDVPSTCADITLANSLLNYTPKTHISDGVRKFAEWYLKEYRSTY